MRKSCSGFKQIGSFLSTEKIVNLKLPKRFSLNLNILAGPDNEVPIQGVSFSKGLPLRVSATFIHFATWY